MASIKRHKVLLDQSAAGSGEWVRLDARYEEAPERPIQVDVVTGDTITLEATSYEVKGDPNATTTGLASLSADDITIIETFTEDGNGVIAGYWTFIRVTKTGTTGNAKVQGYV